MRRASACKRVYIGFNGGGSDTSRVPYGEPYAGKLQVRFDEGAGVPHGAARVGQKMQYDVKRENMIKYIGLFRSRRGNCWF